MLVGIVSIKIGLINANGVASLSNIVIYIASPALILNSFQNRLSASQLMDAGYMLLIITVLYGGAIIISKLFYRHSFPLDRFAIVFANLGFVGIPLAQSVLGPTSVIYMGIFVSYSNFWVWTYGLILASGSVAKMSVRKLLLNPCIVAMVIGIVMMACGLQFPGMVQESITQVSALNMPLVMIVLGSYLAQGDLKQYLKLPRFYLTCLGRLIVVPLAVVLALKLVPERLELVKLTILLGWTTPVAALMAIFSEKYEGDFSYSSVVVGMSTVFSLVTIPLVIGIANVFW